MRRATVAVPLLLLAVASHIACGKVGDPLPPLRPVPARIADASARRAHQGVTLKFTVPQTNLDGTAPPSITRIDVYAWRGTAGAIPPAAAVIASEQGNLRGSLPVSIPAGDEAAPLPASPGAVPGAVATFEDRLANLDTTGVVTLAYVLVPVSARGRTGPPSPPLVVPMGELPAPPSSLRLRHTETELQATWVAPPTTGVTFHLVRTTSAGAPIDSAGPSAPTPVSTLQASVPVEFGREVCLAVRSIVVAGPVTIEGPLSKPACATAIDLYPPPPPAGFQAVQEGAAVVLSWSAITAGDLAGYTVLRGSDSADNLQPLMRTPITTTTYRDADVRPGVTYFYAVYAQDGASPPNVSQLSGRQSLTVR